MYIRKIKKGNKTYSYYYKSQRIGNKVKSIYIGRNLDNEIKKPTLNKTNKESKNKNLSLVDNLLNFDRLLNETNILISNKNLHHALFAYSQLFEAYKDLDVDAQDKSKLFEKLNNIYNSLVELSQENKINLLK